MIKYYTIIQFMYQSSQKLIVPHGYSRNFLHFMEPKDAYKPTPLGPILIQINPVHAIPSYCFKIQFHIILPSTTMSSKVTWFSSSFPCIYLLCPSNHIGFSIPNNMWLVKLEYMFTHYAVFPPSHTASHLDPNSLLNTLFSSTSYYVLPLL